VNTRERLSLFTRAKSKADTISESEWLRFNHDAELLSELESVRRVLVRGMLRQWQGASAAERERMQRIVRDAKEQAVRRLGRDPRTFTEVAGGISAGLEPHDWANLDEAVFGAATRLRREDGESAGEAGERSASTSQDTGDEQHDERK
jgi:hypothetical protein